MDAKYLHMLFRQTKVLAWKNFILKFRRWTVLLFEIMIPLAVIMGLWAIKLVVNPKKLGPDIPTTMDVVSSFKYQYSPGNYGNVCWRRNLVWSCQIAGSCYEDYGYPGIYEQKGCMPMQIAIAPADPNNAGAVQAVVDFMAWVDDMYPSSEEFPGPANYSTFVSFPSEADFEAYLDQPLYSLDSSLHIFSSAIIFNSAAPSWDFSLRLNSTVQTAFTEEAAMISSRNIKLDISMKRGAQIPLLYADTYLRMFSENSYFALAEIANSFVATKTCQQATAASASAGATTPRCLSGENVAVRMVGAVAFPNGEVLADSFWSALGGTFALLLIIAIMYPLANITKSLVHEKETKTRQGMLMMALSGEALWASWILHFLCLLIPLSVILTFASMGLFEYSDLSYILLYFFSFLLSAMSFCVFVSVFFDKSRTASIVGNLAFFAGFFIPVGLDGTTASKSSLLLGCLHPAAAFTYGTLAFQEYEDAQVGISVNTWDHSELYAITFRDTVMMMLIDVVVLFALAGYFGAIWPSEFGTQRPWYFIFQPSFYKSVIPVEYLNYMCWCVTQSTVFQKVQTTEEGEGSRQVELSAAGVIAGGSNTGVMDGEAHMDSVEPVTEDLARQRTTGMCVDIQHLTKTFDTPTGKKTAVDNLSVTMYSGQITSLLGHNGAGKSVLVSMLTGLFAPTSGTATILGHSIKDDMNELRQNLGVCPQHDILFPDLTVHEHLVMFAAFKGTPAEDIEAEVEKMILSVGLVEKRHAAAKTLSGGQKRKLSVGLAFIGNSKVVILDEPTSGMDPYSRRFTWDVIRQHREGRVVILITHFMDEADLLGDRIAIMGDGQLRCCGSSLFLKRFYGVGYNMTIEKKDISTFQSAVVRELVSKHIPGSKMVTDVGAELTFQLPFSSSHKFKEMFELIDEQQESLGVESYGISVTTLEEVFIKTARGTDTIARAEEGRQKGRVGGVDAAAIDVDVSLNVTGVEENGKQQKETVRGDGVSAAGDASNAIPVVESNGPVDTSPATDTPVAADVLESGYKIVEQESAEIRAISFDRVREDAKWYMFTRHVTAMLTKRYLTFWRDQKTWVMQFIVPALFVLAGVLILLYVLVNHSQPSLELSAGMYNGGIANDHLPFPYANANQMCYTYGSCSSIPPHSQDNIMAALPLEGFNSYPPLPIAGADHIVNVSTALLDGFNGYKASVFGAVSLFANHTFTEGGSLDGSPFVGHMYEYAIHSNYTAVFGGPLFNSLVAEAIVRTINPEESVTTRYYPMPITANQGAFNDSINLNTAFMFLTLALAVIPASFAMNVVREKEVNTKAQQLLSGVSISAYWIATELWDFLSYQVTVVLLMVILGSVTISGNYLSPYENFVLFLLLEFYGLAVLGFTYILSFLFPDASTAQISVLFINFIVGFALSIVGMVLRILPSTHDAYMGYIRYLFFLSPLCAAGDGLNNLTARVIWGIMEKGPGESYSVLDYNITGLNLIMLGWQSVAYLMITIGIEYVGGLSIYQAWINQFVIKFPVEPLTPEGQGAWSVVKDRDVKQEEARVKEQVAAGTATDTIVLEDVHKVYGTGKHAIKGVTLGIPNGECFGLLGTNGAGKSTLLSMLSGELAPTFGEVTLSGLHMSTNSHACRKNIGFCPQFDALFELLTAREHLALYARLKGIAEADIETVVNDKISQMGLSEYQNRLAGTYSGGNKRKLSVAIAMIGEPSIVFLDEPSTGIDPAARRFMWDIISDIVTKRAKCCLVLTTHNMEEAEALCTRVGIMVGGVFRCLGPMQHLRTEYGHGYQIEFDLCIPTHDAINEKCAELVTLATNNFPTFKCVETAHYGECTVQADQLTELFKLSGKEGWSARISPVGTGSDIYAAQMQNEGCVTLKHLASWWLLEVVYDRLCGFLTEQFHAYVLRERHSSKIRVEVDAQDPETHIPLKLAGIFGAIESAKEMLDLQGYSVSQTSLEQIFNQFAAQQEEEKLHGV